MHSDATKNRPCSLLEDALPNYWQEIFNLACYLISSGDPFLYCEDWLNSTECLPVGSMSSQRISELLIAITPDARENFYQTWCTYRSEQEYLALDITSISSYSNLIEEWVIAAMLIIFSFVMSSFVMLDPFKH